MKVSLVVASGAHQGKVIPITGPQFLIGRDAQCHLRPASQAISKQHCGLLIRDGQVFVKDYGSTNGTTVNEELLKGAELPVVNGATLKLGPLDFTIRIETSAPIADGTPLPGNSPEAMAALAAVKAATGTLASQKSPTPSRDATPNPAQARPAQSKSAQPGKPTPAGSKDSKSLTVPKESRPSSGSKEAAALTGSKEAAALKAAPTKPAPDQEPTVLSTSLSLSSSDEDDKMAAMLLDMDDEAGVPEGSTVVLPALDSQGNPIVPPEAKPEEKAKKPVQTREEMTSAASDLLRKMMRRPK